jgi:hypothetical protein
MPDGMELTVREARSVEYDEIADLTVAAYRTIVPDLRSASMVASCPT